MKKSTFGCWGHAFNRKFLYTTKDGKFNEVTVPGGAALIQRLLTGKELYRPLDTTCRCEHFELQLFEEKQPPKSYYAISRRLGFTEGDVIFRSYEADYAVVLDEGLGKITLPEGNMPVLWASNKALPKQEIFGKIAEHCFLLLDADVLRNSGAMISSRISWERTATELVWQLQNNEALACLRRAAQVLITFAEDGAVYFNREKGLSGASLVLAHGGGEGALRGKIKGSIDDSFACMTTALALQLPAVAEGKQPLRILPVLKAAENLLTGGYSPDKLADGDFDLSGAEVDLPDTSFDIPFTPGQGATDSDFWCISNHVENKRIFDIACEYVQKGAKVIEGLPQLSFGALTTIDRREIESYRNICNLIENYVHSDNVRPLSVAVFGAPGSGKSFGVTQIAENISSKVEKLEFNVSQFSDNADLGAAFQRVRDVILAGRLPLVFFDEFDSDRNGTPLGWVKSFLMPMQDGKFKDDSGLHPLGKCILVFAGGTSPSFEEFIKPMFSEADEQKFRNLKAPDFVSRLRGTIDVLGPNQTGENDRNYILRRALLLRSLCERKLKIRKGAVAPVSKHILWAMLLVPTYRHGARSMEAILDMSRLEGHVWEPVALPFHSQLSLHVDADAFLRLVLREEILNSYMEKLAIAIHQNYLTEMIATGNVDHPSAVPWEELSEEFKESNRNQALDMAKKLQSVGYDYDCGDTPFPSVKQFDREIVLSLAQKEHDRWMAEKVANGWKYAPLILENSRSTAETIREMRKDKFSHLLINWDNLEQEERNKDIKAVENIIPLLESAGLRVYKTI
ncbi:MAG: AAA family ATPase [Tannerella sp.]|jgi:hypothetical protein|nr:AAA family ATPase [Tannerella sp.]